MVPLGISLATGKETSYVSIDTNREESYSDFTNGVLVSTTKKPEGLAGLYTAERALRDWLQQRLLLHGTLDMAAPPKE